jgi:LysM repeat protein
VAIYLGTVHFILITFKVIDLSYDILRLCYGLGYPLETMEAVYFDPQRSFPVTLAVVGDYTHKPEQPLAMLNITPVATENFPAASSSQVAPVSTVLNPTPTETEFVIPQNVEEYEVEAGDTLGLIAEKFDVSVEDLLKINQIKDANSLSVGMIIYIPGPGGVAPTIGVTPTRTPNLGPTGTPSGPPVEARVIINSVIGAGDIASEHVFLSRAGDGELPMAGWQLLDEDGNIFVFPQLTLFRDGAVNVWTTSGNPTVVDLYWGLQSPVWERGEKVTLTDAGGKVHTSYTIP